MIQVGTSKGGDENNASESIVGTEPHSGIEDYGIKSEEFNSVTNARLALLNVAV